YASIKLHFETDVDVVAAQKGLTELRGQGVKVDPQTGTGTQASDLLVQWPVSAKTQTWELFRQVRDGFENLKDVNGKPVKLSNPFPEAEEIQGRMVKELRNSAIGAVILAWGLIILYLRVRFHEYKWGIAAVVALVHDVLVALGAVVVF